MERQEQQAHHKNQTDVLSCFDHLGEHTSWKEAMGTEHTCYMAITFMTFCLL